MSEWKAKRFWENATTVAECEGYGIQLDGRAVHTPARARLIVPTLPLAQEIAAEWDAQGEKIDPDSMPFTKAANAAIDKVAIQKAEVADLLVAYGDSDLLCYRADGPDGLVARQNDAWDPLLDWAADVLGARLHTRTGVVHVPQDSDVILRLSEQVHALSNFELAAFHDLVSLSGSLVLAFAILHGLRPAEELWKTSRVDEIWQIEQWGEDAEANELEKVKCQSFMNAERFYALLARKT